MAIGGLLAIAAAGLLGAVRGDISQANAALALVLIVVLAAFTGGRWAGVSTGIVAAVSPGVYGRSSARYACTLSRKAYAATAEFGPRLEKYVPAGL